MEKIFTLEYWQDEGWYVGRLKEIPSIFSQGETLLDLKENIKDVYHLMMEEEAMPLIETQVEQEKIAV